MAPLQGLHNDGGMGMRLKGVRFGSGCGRMWNKHLSGQGWGDILHEQMPWNGGSPGSDSSAAVLFWADYEMVSPDASCPPPSSPCISGSLYSLGGSTTGALVVKLLLFALCGFWPTPQHLHLPPAGQGASLSNHVTVLCSGVPAPGPAPLLTQLCAREEGRHLGLLNVVL